MALDEALLDSVSRLGLPVLRFYAWSDPAASFGYSQKYTDVAQWTPVRPLVRRPTGGGLVLHVSDWTYSVVFPREHSWYRLRAAESYAQIHWWVQSVFVKLGVDASLAGVSAHGLAGKCFARSEKSDLVYGGKKIAGAAQRRSRTGLLIQGSVQLGSLNIDKERWKDLMKAAVPTGKESAWSALQLDSDLVGRVKILMEGKYTRKKYHERR